MFCGSCLHDNTLVAALRQLGHDALLIPTYTPIHTDEPSVSLDRVFFGGINVFLQQKFALFRQTPWQLDRLFDSPPLLRWVSRWAAKTRAEELGELTLSMLQGEHGRQRKEVAKLVCWLAQEFRPEIVNLTNVLLAGLVPEIKRALGVPVVATLQGDDLFIESLPEHARKEALDLIRGHCREIDGFIATSSAYADFMAGYLNLPRNGIHVVYPGLNLQGYGVKPPPQEERPFTVGFFARICPEKGLHLLAEAFALLPHTSETAPARLHVSGWLGENHRSYLMGIRRGLQRQGLGKGFVHRASPDHASKVCFLQDLDVFSVPTTFREPKGLYVLEALANGVPVVQPRHGSFPELLEATGGGLLVNPGDPHDLARALQYLRDNPARRLEMGQRGREVVHQRFHARAMAEDTLSVYRNYL
jgi:glycosyltransferase involved in cell wall biosynthesis